MSYPLVISTKERGDLPVTPTDMNYTVNGQPLTIHEMQPVEVLHDELVTAWVRVPVRFGG